MSAKAQRLLDVLWRAFRDLERYRDARAPEEFLSDHDAQRTALHALYEASQACIDLGIHVLVERGLDVPATYREVFQRLSGAGLIPRELAARMEEWAGLRNVIAHFYAVVVPEKIDRVLRNDLGHLADYARAVEALIAQAP